MADSTSSGKTFSPPVFMLTEPRPCMTMVPSSATLAMSPGRTHRTPSFSMNVAAVFSRSL